MWVVEYERERLRNKNCLAEADALQRVSEVDVCAGYDVASFDGRSKEFAFDRFIEVKSTTGTDLVFVWSRNEIATAGHLGGRYWLYLLTRFGGGYQSPKLTTVQNPARILRRRGGISLQPIQFRAELTP